MSFRRILLKIMLWSLGFAALTGVGAILLSGGDIAWRVTGSGLVTALAAGLLIPMSLLMDRERTRLAGCLGMGGVILEFVGAVLLIWEVVRRIGRGTEQQVAETMAAVGLIGLWGLVGLVLVPRSRTRLCGVVWAGTSGTALLIMLLAIWGRWAAGGIDDKLVATGAVVLGGGLLSSVCLIDIRDPRPRRWPWLGVVGTMLGAALWLADIWVDAGSAVGTVACSALTAIGACCAHANLVRLCGLTAGQRWLRGTTIAAVIATASWIVVLVIEDQLVDLPAFWVERLWRFSGAAGIVAGCGTLALLVLARLNRSVEATPGAVEQEDVQVVCPRCGTHLRLALGGDRCTSCDLRIRVEVQEPRCAACGYLLYRLSESRCPECGNDLQPVNGSHGAV